jgi:hypothetical protein
MNGGGKGGWRKKSKRTRSRRRRFFYYYSLSFIIPFSTHPLISFERRSKKDVADVPRGSFSSCDSLSLGTHTFRTERRKKKKKKERNRRRRRSIDDAVRVAVQSSLWQPLMNDPSKRIYYIFFFSSSSSFTFLFSFK